MLVIDAFAQQVIRYYNCSVPVDEEEISVRQTQKYSVLKVSQKDKKLTSNSSRHLERISMKVKITLTKSHH